MTTSGKRPRSSSAPVRARLKPGGTVTAGLDIGSDKLYFKIGEVSQIVGVPPYVLRYWETEFKSIRPQKSRTRQRVYRRKDVETLLKIKQLLYAEKFTIAGARKQLQEACGELETAPANGSYLAKQSLDRVRSQVDELLGWVRSPESWEPSAADPAGFMRTAGGARALLASTDDAGSDSRPALTRAERENV